MAPERSRASLRSLRGFRCGIGALLSLVVLTANPVSGCAIACLLHHHTAHMGHHADASMAGVAGHPCHGDAVTVPPTVAQWVLSPDHSVVRTVFVPPAMQAVPTRARTNVPARYAGSPPTPPP